MSCDMIFPTMWHFDRNRRRLSLCTLLLIIETKCCSFSSLPGIEYSSDLQRLWSDCAYAHAGLSLCLSHIPHCWKSHFVTHIWTSLLFFGEMLRSAITDLFCFGAKSIHKLNSNSKNQEVVSDYIFKESVNLHFCVYVHFFDMKQRKME